MDNFFISYIRQGRIQGLEELKKTYRRMVLKTHPDTVGSDRLVEEYIACRNSYEQARELLEEEAKRHGARNHRLLFYREYYRLGMIDMPFAFNKYYFNRQQIQLSRQRALEHFVRWQKERTALYAEANRIYDQIKLEKPRSPYRKHAMLFNLSSVFHNILSYQLTGLEFYRQQLRQNLETVLFQLEQRGFRNLIEFIRFLISDMENVPAFHDPN
jgi:curved DNA-binding protein CbpA